MSDIESFQTQAEAQEWLERRFDSTDNPDNFRCARLNDPAAMRVYAETVADGCCGSFDAIVLIDGHETLIGCNFGH